MKRLLLLKFLIRHNGFYRKEVSKIQLNSSFIELRKDFIYTTEVIITRITIPKHIV